MVKQSDSCTSGLSGMSYGFNVYNRFACLLVEPHLMIVLILPLCPDSSYMNSSCLTPQLSPAIFLSSNSSLVPCSYGTHSAVLLTPNSECSGNLSLFQGISSPTSVDKEPSLSSSLLSSDNAGSGVCETVDPPDGLRDLSCFTFNNLSSCSLCSMVEQLQFSESVRDIGLPWGGCIFVGVSLH